MQPFQHFACLDSVQVPADHHKPTDRRHGGAFGSIFPGSRSSVNQRLYEKGCECHRTGVGVARGEYGDLIYANEERWHRATSCPSIGRSIRMAITSRSKEGQVHYFQTDQPAGN